MLRWLPVVLLLLATPPASARTVGETRSFPVSGPVLTPSGVAWSTPRAVRFSPDGGPAQTVFDQPAAVTSGGDRLGALVTHSEQNDGCAKYVACSFDSQPFAGPVTGPLESLGKLCYSDGELAGLAVTDDAEISTGSDCRFVLRDGAGELTLPDGARRPALAGPFAAYLDDPTPIPASDETLVVLDRRTREEILRVAVPSRSVDAYDLDADGSVAVVLGEDRIEAQAATRVQGVFTASPGTPEPRRVLPDVVTTIGYGYGYAVRLAAGRLLVRTRNHGRGRLALVDTETGAIRTVVAPAGPGFDFDGDRVAWLSPSCDSVRIEVAALADLPGSQPGPRGCRLQLVGRPVLNRRARDLRVRVACAGAASDCVLGSEQLVTAPRPHRSVVLRGHDGFDPDGTLYKTLTLAAAHRLRTGRPLRVRLSGRLLGAGDASSTGRRSVIFTLRR